MADLKKAPKDLRKEEPTKLSDLTKQNMLKYMKDEAYEDRIWFVELMEKYEKEKDSNLPGHEGEVIQGYDMPKIRQEFAKKYFPGLVKKKEKKVDDFKTELQKLREAK